MASYQQIAVVRYPTKLLYAAIDEENRIAEAASNEPRSLPMTDRAYLHQLVDRIPNDLLENAQRALEYQAIAPSPVGGPPQDTVEAIRHRLREQIAQPDDWETLREKMRRGIERRDRRRDMNGIHIPGTQPDGASSHVQGRDKEGALLRLTFLHFKGQRLEMAERISVSPDGRLLIYRQDLTGPDRQHSYHEAQFSISDFA